MWGHAAMDAFLVWFDVALEPSIERYLEGRIPHHSFRCPLALVQQALDAGPRAGVWDMLYVRTLRTTWSPIVQRHVLVPLGLRVHSQIGSATGLGT